MRSGTNNSKSKFILVTGGAGYIGSETVRALIRKGFNPIVVDNLSTGFQAAVPREVPFFNGDVRDFDLIAKIFAAFEIRAVIHLAAKIVIEESIQNPVTYYDNNINSLLNVIRVCNKFDVKKIIFSSSGTVYGNSNYKPGLQKNISESDNTEPLSPYGHSKRMGEVILSDAQKAYGIDSISLRYFNVAGASPDGENGQRRNIATHLLHVASKAALVENSEVTIYGNDYTTTDGTCIRDYIHVSDLADIHVNALEFILQQKTNLILNCGYGRGFSVSEVLATFQKVNKLKLNIKYGPRRPGDPESLIGDSSRLIQLLNWKAKHDDLAFICETAFRWQSRLNN